jgi:hypothetical protein
VFPLNDAQPFSKPISISAFFFMIRIVSAICLSFLCCTGFALAQAPVQQTPSQAQKAASAQTPAQAPVQNPANRPGRGGVVRGTLKDDTGGIIPGAPVTLRESSGGVQTVNTGADGTFVFRNVAPGDYSVLATYTGLQQKQPLAVSVRAGQPTNVDVVMGIAEQKQELTVTDSTANQVSTDPASNASALTLKPEDLDALPDDPDDLQADLQALAGPSAGPGGNQIYVDGFTGGRLPPKESIREIRINSNPFSAEFDKLGYGRIQILTKPGSDKFHGQGYYNISDDVWNSRNPFLTTSPPFRAQLFGGNVSGPVGKKASFFVDVERRNIDDNGIITAGLPTADFLGTERLQSFYPTPQRRTTVSPRLDWQLNTNNTLSFRYTFLNNDRQLTHIGSFNIPDTTIGAINYQSNGYSQNVTEQTAQIVETAVLSSHVVNETHFEYDRERQNTTSSSLGPQLNVAQSFVAGGSGYSSASFPNSYDLQNYYELQNYTSISWGAHTTKAGFRIRATALDDFSPLNFNGEYFFNGGTNGLSSIDQYLVTERLLASGLSSQAVSALGYGPSKFTINQGNPYVGFAQLDFGPFVQDDWRVRPNLTLSLGLRWESQNNINDKNDWAPRFGFAWSPGNSNGRGRAKTVVRGGWGIFYDRFAITNVEQAYRYNGINQTQYTVNNPTSYDAAFSIIPPQSELVQANAAQHYLIDSNLKAPRLMQTVVGVERQLFSHTTLSLNFLNSRGTHQLLTNDINAPIPIDGQLPPGTETANVGPTLGPVVVGPRPYGEIGDLYDYQSVGVFKQTQGLVSLNSTIGKSITIFSRYSYTQAKSDTDGLTTVPSNPYNIGQDWGRSVLDSHHSLFLGGSIAAKWGLRLSPFIVLHSGIPYNITTGTDLYLVGSGTPTARPQVVDSSFPNAVATPIGYLNLNPLVGAPLIGRNSETAPGFIGINLRLSKTWGFGTTHFKGQAGGSRAGGGGGGGGRRGGFGGGGGMFGGGESTEHRYNLTLGINARNILNHENLNTPNGAVTSLFFLQSTNISGGYGAESTVSNQRRIDLQLRFSF